MKLPILITLLLISTIGYAKNSPLKADTCDTLNNVVKPYVDSHMLQGQLLLAQDGEVLCQSVKGFTDHQQHQPITADSQFPIASLSKPMMATLLLKLEEKKILNLSLPIAHYLPSFRAPWANKVSLHHLLANRSGLPNHFMLPGWEQGQFQSSLPDSELLDIVAKMALSFEAGTDYQYSNLGWLLLGHVIETVTQKSLNENLQQHFFTPLNMEDSGLVYGANTTLVTGLRWGVNGHWSPQKPLNMQVFNAGAGIFSTALDISKFTAAIHQGNFINNVSSQKMFSTGTPYGWRLETLELNNGIEKQVHSYDGQLEGYSSLAVHVLEDNVTFILLTNTGMGIRHKNTLATDVLSVFYGADIPDRSKAKSLALHKGILNGEWTDTLAHLMQQPVNNMVDIALLYDLAQQLEWSGNLDKAIDLFKWLSVSLPDNVAIAEHIERLRLRSSSHTNS